MPHEEGAGLPSTSTTDEKIQQAWEIVRTNRRVIIDEVAYSLQISHGSAYQIIHDELGFHTVCARWVPKELTMEHKRKHLEVCQHLLDGYNNDGEEFLSRIISGNETWVYHCEAEAKRQSMEWKHPGSPATKKFKNQASTGEVMLTLFWDSKGPILEDYLQKGCTIKSAWYSALLAKKLKPAICTNAKAYCQRKFYCCMTMHTQLDFEVLKHPAYSLDLALSDYHLL